jgi:hypothetical protein
MLIQLKLLKLMLLVLLTVQLMLQVQVHVQATQQLPPNSKPQEPFLDRALMERGMSKVIRRLIVLLPHQAMV